MKDFKISKINLVQKYFSYKDLANDIPRINSINTHNARSSSKKIEKKVPDLNTILVNSIGTKKSTKVLLSPLNNNCNFAADFELKKKKTLNNPESDFKLIGNHFKDRMFSLANLRLDTHTKKNPIGPTKDNVVKFYASIKQKTQYNDKNDIKVPVPQKINEKNKKNQKILELCESPISISAWKSE